MSTDDTDDLAADLDRGVVAPAANHHAHHPGFAGVTGVLAAISFLFGRGDGADLVVRLAALRSGERVVDVGCGPGVAAVRARSLGADVIGVDPSQAMLRVARLRWRRRVGVDWRIGTAERLPLGAGWAQVVWSLSTVHHWVDVEAGVVEARRVLADGGRFVVLERRIVDTAARGSASHGWTRAQADSFAATCRRQGFADVDVTEHEGLTVVLSVVARKPDEVDAAAGQAERRERSGG